MIDDWVASYFLLSFLDFKSKMADESLCIIAVDKSLSGKVDGNTENWISSIESFIVDFFNPEQLAS